MRSIFHTIEDRISVRSLAASKLRLFRPVPLLRERRAVFFQQILDRLVEQTAFGDARRAGERVKQRHKLIFQRRGKARAVFQIRFCY